MNGQIASFVSSLDIKGIYIVSKVVSWQRDESGKPFETYEIQIEYEDGGLIFQQFKNPDLLNEAGAWIVEKIRRGEDEIHEGRTETA